MKMMSILKVFSGVLFTIVVILGLNGCMNTQLSQDAKDNISANADRIADLVGETTHYRADCSITIEAQDNRGIPLKDPIIVNVIGSEPWQVISNRIQEA